MSEPDTTGLHSLLKEKETDSESIPVTNTPAAIVKPKIWHHQHEVILKEWAEISSSYRWLHYNSYRNNKNKHILFTLPVIIISTLTGTANFAQKSIPDNFATYFPIIIGSLNLIAAIISTCAQFLRIAELSEKHRASYLAFGKLYRNIKVELSLPVQCRNNNGIDFIKSCKSEFDRLLDNGALIDKKLLAEYESKFNNILIAKPDILRVDSVEIFIDSSPVAVTPPDDVIKV